MKLKIKKYIVAINDISNLLLKKEHNHSQEQIKNLKLVLKLVIALLLISVVFNVYCCLK